MPSSGSTVPIYKVKAVDYATYSDFFFRFIYLIPDRRFIVYGIYEVRI